MKIAKKKGLKMIEMTYMPKFSPMPLPIINFPWNLAHLSGTQISLNGNQYFPSQIRILAHQRNQFSFKYKNKY